MIEDEGMANDPGRYADETVLSPDEKSEERDAPAAKAPSRSGYAGDAAARGVVLHKALERLDYAKARAMCTGPDADIEGWIASYLDGLVSGGFLTPEQRASASAGDLARFVSSDICARVAASPRVRRETPFNYRMTMDGEQVIVQGVIDLFFEEGDGLVLVDFKSGGARLDATERAEHAIATYGAQMSLYRDALEGITGKRVVESLLYLTAYGQTVSVPREVVFLQGEATGCPVKSCCD
jgi:ATP-dependent helicase/nuclease subunit A